MLRSARSASKEVNSLPKQVRLNRTFHPMLALVLHGLKEATAHKFVSSKHLSVFFPLDVKALHPFRRGASRSAKKAFKSIKHAATQYGDRDDWSSRQHFAPSLRA